MFTITKYKHFIKYKLLLLCWLQGNLSRGTRACVQDPSYPVYVDSSVIIGSTGNYQDEGFEGI